MKYILAGVSLILLITLSSCIFSPDKENFIELDQNVSAPEISNQTLDLDADTLQVWRTTRYSFNFKSTKQPVRTVVVRYADKELRFSSASGSIEINPSILAEGITQMEVKVITGSGTGSMADIMGAEGFEFKKSWVLIIEKAVAPEIHISTSIENGFLKFSWNTMNKPYIQSLRYMIDNKTNYSSYGKETVDKKVTSIVDSLYIGGKINFRFFVYYQDANGSNRVEVKNIEYDYPISVSYKLDIHNLTFFWTQNPFHYTTLLGIQGHNLTAMVADTSCTIPSPGLGYDMYYEINFRSKYQPANGNHMLRSYLKLTLGTRDGMGHNNVLYNPIFDTYFFKHEAALKVANKNIIKTDSLTYPWTPGDSYSLAFSKDHQKVYSTLNNNLLTLNATGLGLIHSQSLAVLPETPSTTYLLRSLDDQTMLMGYQFSGGYRFVVFNPLNGLIFDQSDIMPNEMSSMGNYIMDVSSDGKYAALSYMKGLYLFEINSNKQLSLRYHDTQPCYNGLFDPKYAERLILNRVNDIVIFNCSTLQTGKTIPLLANPINIDPLTHNLLMVSNSKKKIYIYDYENDVIRLEMSHHGFAKDFKLLNNVIFDNTGYHFDISSYVD